MNRFDINDLLNEASFNFSRSGGKGGQNVNKVETKVELVFNIPASLVLDEKSKARLLERLSSKTDKEGNIHIISQTERTQIGNRKKAVQKFEAVIKNALKKEKKRKKTRLPESAKKKILEEKRKHGEKKRERKRVEISE